MMLLRFLCFCFLIHSLNLQAAADDFPDFSGYSEDQLLEHLKDSSTKHKLFAEHQLFLQVFGQEKWSEELCKFVERYKIEGAENTQSEIVFIWLQTLFRLSLNHAGVSQRHFFIERYFSITEMLEWDINDKLLRESFFKTLSKVILTAYQTPEYASKLLEKFFSYMKEKELNLTEEDLNLILFYLIKYWNYDSLESIGNTNAYVILKVLKEHIPNFPFASLLVEHLRRLPLISSSHRVKIQGHYHIIMMDESALRLTLSFFLKELQVELSDEQRLEIMSILQEYDLESVFYEILARASESSSELLSQEVRVNRPDHQQRSGNRLENLIFSTGRLHGAGCYR